MPKFKIAHIHIPSTDTSNSSRSLKEGDTIKESFWLNNLSMDVCVAMVLNINIEEMQKNNPHGILYGKYVGGFVFEGFQELPPLCILQVVLNGRPNNAVYYNDTVFDPQLGMFPVAEYNQKRLKILSYIQIFISEAYEDIDWKPGVPDEIKAELKKDQSLETIWESLSPMNQSKILNYAYPFSRPSSLKEKRIASTPLKPKQVEVIVCHIRSMRPSAGESWREELRVFETIEAVQTLKQCGIEVGMTVLDMGCGHGHYTIPAAIAVGGQGKVIAVDINKKVIKEAEKRTQEFNRKNILFLNTNENGLVDYRDNIDFIMLYDVLHGGAWAEGKKGKLRIMHSLLKDRGILSLALFNEIEHRIPENAKPNPKGHYSTVRISHEEAITPYIELLESCGYQLDKVVENGGVHFDDFHNPSKWRKYGEIRINTLERRNIYNFVKK